ncbi:hypothetical protein GDO86_009877 [Hymenochirus boettgeri]|uniref:Galactosylgalactosylxylosylprotein 3-beta-glucuronosyltransferase n=1 Tax=Hymenochirus boettgeri TaxID=247094 RepID=A0A8T2JR49_9PIPI|nr:hypothetical protein GDO86_009877 [Hymenochirus boettgeri]
MKSLFYSRFFILLPWVLIVVIIIDPDTRRSSSPNRVPPSRTHSPYWHRRVGRAALTRPQPSDPPAGTRATKQGHLATTGTLGGKNDTLPVIFAITPTYSRPVQKAELTRLANTFRQVPRLHWIVVEDSAQPTELVSRFLSGAGVRASHLHVPTPRRYKRAGLPRATEQRNAGLAWLRQGYHSPRIPPTVGVVFFADDDNTYSLELFEEVFHLMAGLKVALG